MGAPAGSAAPQGARHHKRSESGRTASSLSLTIPLSLLASGAGINSPSIGEVVTAAPGLGSWMDAQARGGSGAGAGSVAAVAVAAAAAAAQGAAEGGARRFSRSSSEEPDASASGAPSSAPGDGDLAAAGGGSGLRAGRQAAPRSGAPVYQHLCAY